MKKKSRKLTALLIAFAMVFTLLWNSKITLAGNGKQNIHFDYLYDNLKSGYESLEITLTHSDGAKFTASAAEDKLKNVPYGTYTVSVTLNGNPVDGITLYYVVGNDEDLAEAEIQLIAVSVGGELIVDDFTPTFHFLSLVLNEADEDEEDPVDEDEEEEDPVDEDEKEVEPEDEDEEEEDPVDEDEEEEEPEDEDEEEEDPVDEDEEEEDPEDEDEEEENPVDEDEEEEDPEDEDDEEEDPVDEDEEEENPEDEDEEEEEVDSKEEVADEDEAEEEVEAEPNNDNDLETLPQTGGVPSILFYAFGMISMSGGAFLLKKKE